MQSLLYWPKEVTWMSVPRCEEVYSTPFVGGIVESSGKGCRYMEEKSIGEITAI